MLMLNDFIFHSYLFVCVHFFCRLWILYLPIHPVRKTTMTRKMFFSFQFLRVFNCEFSLYMFWSVFFFLYCLWHWFKQKIKQHLSNNFIKNANHNISFSLSLSLCFHLEQWDSYPFVSRILYLYGVIQMSTWMLIKSN